MKLFYLNIVILILCLICHGIIIEQSGQNNIIFDVILFGCLLVLFCLNIYSVFLLFKRIEKPVVFALFLSLLYYIMLFFFPIFQGSR